MTPIKIKSLSFFLSLRGQKTLKSVFLRHPVYIFNAKHLYSRLLTSLSKSLVSFDRKVTIVLDNYSLFSYQIENEQIAFIIYFFNFLIDFKLHKKITSKNLTRLSSETHNRLRHIIFSWLISYLLLVFPNLTHFIITSCFVSLIDMIISRGILHKKRHIKMFQIFPNFVFNRKFKYSEIVIGFFRHSSYR